MSNNSFLSQEEIDALLKKTSGSAQTDADHMQAVPHSLNETEADALGEIGNICFGSSATALSMILSNRVQINTPQVEVISKANLIEQFHTPYVMVEVDFTEGLQGHNILILPVHEAQVIANMMMGANDSTGDQEELTDLQLSAVQEAMNQMMGSAATSMASMFGIGVNISPPVARVINFHEEGEQLELPDWLVQVAFRLKIGTLIDSQMMQVIPIAFAKEMVRALMKGEELSSTPPESDASVKQQPPEDHPQDPARVASEHPKDDPGVSVQAAQFTPLKEQEHSPASRNLDLLLDVPMQISVELGRTRKMIREVLDLAPGSVVELDKLAGEPVDILVNQKLIARGEVVVIDENFGVRVTDILDPRKRLATFKKQ